MLAEWVALQIAEDRAQPPQGICQIQRIAKQVAHLVAAQDVERDIGQHRADPQRRQSGQHIQREQDRVGGGQPQQQSQRGPDRGGRGVARQPVQQALAGPLRAETRFAAGGGQGQPVAEAGQRDQLVQDRLPSGDGGRVGVAPQQPVQQALAALAGGGGIDQAVQAVRAGQVEIGGEGVFGRDLGAEGRRQRVPVQPDAGGVFGLDGAVAGLVVVTGIHRPVTAHHEREHDDQRGQRG